MKLLSHLRRHIGRLVAVFFVNALSLLLMSWILPGLSVNGWAAVGGSIVILAVANAVVWPLVARYLAGAILWTAGLLGLVANGLLLMLTAEIVNGLFVSGLGAAMVASLGMTAITAVAGQLLAIDDDDVWRRRTIRRMVRRLGDVEATTEPGVLFIQIDGLSEPVLRRALSEGYMPTVATWLRSGTHRISGWECDLSSQTGASQAGILHGNNSDMPAFRWYDKEAGKIFTSNRPQDAAEIERQHSNGQGLLVDGGVSRSNVFSGDSPDSMLTFSTVRSEGRPTGKSLTYFVSSPSAFTRLLVLSLADVGREVAASWRARRRDIQPRLKRGGIYPILRAATTVALRDITVYTLLSDIYRGVPSAYVDFVGYDEVAHHSGIAAHDALETLYRLDQQFARIQQVIGEAPRPYHIVVLSDHGQTQGATFLQRYGTSLPDLVASLIEQGQEVHSPAMSDEGWGNVNGILSDVIQSEDSRLAGLVRVITKRRTTNGEVVLGPAARSDPETADSSDVIVLASGNLGLISFPHIAGRATLEALAARHPGLITSLAKHPGVGFILVRSETVGSMVIGAHGVHYLDDGRIEGIDPLAPFGDRAADHVRRTDLFLNCPDLLINSFFDEELDEGAAFEELIGFHGGMGGKQTEPFLLSPHSFDVPDGPIVGAESIHAIFKEWLRSASLRDAPQPWEAPVGTPAPSVIDNIAPGA
ncbi:MAG: uncharacterized membrane protein YvlD (DUF360 family) [Ilumatobacter sp.]|jgi:uncharacterized membrane protein YvlD (DUF360 family)